MTRSAGGARHRPIERGGRRGRPMRRGSCKAPVEVGGRPMDKPIWEIVAAALVAGAVSVFPGLGAVEARTPAPVVKGDRLDIRPLGTACSQQAWPYFEPSCLRDRTRSTGRARTVKIVTTDGMNTTAR